MSGGDKDKKDEKSDKAAKAAASPALSTAASVAATPTAAAAAPAVAAGGPPPFIPRPGETPAEALRRRLREAKTAVTIAPSSTNKIYTPGMGMDDDDILDASGKPYGGLVGEEEEVEVEDPFKPNIFFQNARYSGFAPSPKSLPEHQQLPGTIYFYLRATDVNPIPIHKKLPEKVCEFIIEAKTIKGHESAGPIARLDFTTANVLGLGVRRDALEMGVSQLVIDVPSHEAYPKQDPRIEPSSFTFQPYQISALHGDWLPRVNVPIKADRPRAASPESPLRRRKMPPKFSQDLEDLDKTGIEDDEKASAALPSPEHIGNPYAAPESTRSSPSQRSSRASLASERRLRESMKRMSRMKLEGLPSQRERDESVASTMPASPETPQSQAAAAAFAAATGSCCHGRNDGSRGSICGMSSNMASSPQMRQYGGSGTGSGFGPATGTPTAEPEIKKDDSKKDEGKSLAPTHSKLKARGAVDGLMCSTPGWMSSRSIRSTQSVGVAGGPPERDLWPRDFAADSAREASLEIARDAARKELAKKREKEREAERMRRATRGVGRRGGIAF